MDRFEALFQILRAELSGEALKKEYFESMSEEELVELYKLSKAQDLAHLVGDALSRSGATVSPSVSQAFFKQQMISVYRCERLRDAYERLCSLFEEGEIDFLPLKGAVIRPYYPEPWMRTSCDIDILIREDDIDRATTLITSAFSATVGERNYHDVSFLLNDHVHLELHFHIKENIDSMDTVLSRVWEHSALQKGMEHCYLQSKEFLLFHLAAHNAYHFINGGCGVRPFIDWWLLKRALSVREDELRRLLEEATLTDFADAMDALSKVWFENALPTETVSNMADYILGAGIYGSVENKVAVAKEKSGGKLKYILGRIFMPYSALKISYPRLERMPFLYPFYTVMRWFRMVIKGRTARAVAELRTATTPETERTQRISKMCRELNLIK